MLLLLTSTDLGVNLQGDVQAAAARTSRHNHIAALPHLPPVIQQQWQQPGARQYFIHERQNATCSLKPQHFKGTAHHCSHQWDNQGLSLLQRAKSNRPTANSPARLQQLHRDQQKHTVLKAMEANASPSEPSSSQQSLLYHLILWRRGPGSPGTWSCGPTDRMNSTHMPLGKKTLTARTTKSRSATRWVGMPANAQHNVKGTIKDK